MTIFFVLVFMSRVFFENIFFAKKCLTIFNGLKYFGKMETLMKLNKNGIHIDYDEPYQVILFQPNFAFLLLLRALL